jgi:hypothetical protein
MMAAIVVQVGDVLFGRGSKSVTVSVHITQKVPEWMVGPKA